jgi:hypothetical protein
MLTTLLGGAAGLSVNSAATVGGTLGVTGVVTANAGVVVDNITIDGTQIDLSSGDLTLDVAGKILLSADDAGTIQLFDGSLHYGSISEDNSNLIIQSIIENEDILFKGNDGGSTITALTLDMSEAGAATFNAGITASNAGVIKASRSDNARSLLLYTDNTNATVESDTDPLLLISPETITLDAAGDIILNADGGDWKFQDGATGILEIQNDGTGNAVLITTTSDKDMRFLGNDGGSTITALTLDMSEAGAATFNGNIVIGTAGKGIDFSAATGGTGTATGNLLDDYEEGTWTPQLDANTVTWSYTHQAGNYVKIGNMVHAQFYILASVASGTTSFGASLINLPFTSGNVSSFNNYAVPLWFSGSPDIRPLVNNNSTRCTLQIYNSVSGATAADLDGHYFVGTASYRSA